MTRFHISTAVATIFAAGAAQAEPLRIVTDIAPVQSLVQMVAGDHGVVDVIVRPGATPHAYSMRPSEARALQEADLMVWIGPELTPWLSDPIATVAEGADVLALMDLPQTVTLETREGATFAPHDHDHDHDHDEHEDHDHDHAEEDHTHDHDEDDHAHDDHAHEDHDDHDHDHADAEEHAHDDHAHGGIDPHAWLSPDNAKAWLTVLVGELAEHAPEHAEAFAANAEAGRAAIDAAVAEGEARLAGLGERPFVVYHDAFQYFERAFGLSAAGALSLSDATPPSAARIREIRDLVEAEGVVCAFSEPQFDPGLVDTVFGDALDVSVAVLDPLGAEIPTGPTLYPDLIRAITGSAADCLS